MVFARSQKHPIRQEISLVNFNRPKKNVRIISRPPWFCEICQMALTFGPYKQIRAIVDGLGVMNLCQDGPKNGICAVMTPPNCTSSYPTSQIIYTITNLYHRKPMTAANWLHEGFCGQKTQSSDILFFKSWLPPIFNKTYSWVWSLSHHDQTSLSPPNNAH